MTDYFYNHSISEIGLVALLLGTIVGLISITIYLIIRERR